jgi:hypothetical protein
VGVVAESRDQFAGFLSSDMEAFTERLSGDRMLVYLPVQDVLGSRSVQQILVAGFSRPRSRPVGPREGRGGSILLGRAGRGTGCRRTGPSHVGGLHGLKEVGCDFAPADEQQRADRVERGTAVMAGDQRLGDVQGQGDEGSCPAWAISRNRILDRPKSRRWPRGLPSTWSRLRGRVALASGGLAAQFRDGGVSLGRRRGGPADDLLEFRAPFGVTSDDLSPPPVGRDLVCLGHCGPLSMGMCGSGGAATAPRGTARGGGSGGRTS